MGAEILDAGALLAQSKAKTGLSDFGDDTLPERFGLAVKFLRGQEMDETGQPLFATAEPRSGTNRGDRYGKLKYSTDVIGEDIGALNREFEPYRKRFNLEIEKRGEQ